MDVTLGGWSLLLPCSTVAVLERVGWDAATATRGISVRSEWVLCVVTTSLQAKTPQAECICCLEGCKVDAITGSHEAASCLK